MTGRRSAGALVARCALACALAGCVLLAGCGGPAPRTDPAAGASPKTSGVPIKVMTWAPEGDTDAGHPDLQVVANAFATAVNAAGGINDHPLQVLVCDEQDTPDGAERCARRAVEEDVVGVLGSFSMHADRYLPVLETARIPYLGGVPLTGPDLRSPMSFPVTGGPLVRAAAATVLAGQRGCTRSSLVRGERHQYDAVEDVVRAGLARAGQPGPVVLRAPADPARAADTARRVLGSGDCAIVAAGDRDTRALLAGLEQAGGELPVVLAGGLRGWPAEAPSVAGRTTRVSWFPAPDNAVWQRFRDAVTTPAGAVDVTDPVAQNTWAAYDVFTRVARTMRRYDSTTLLAALGAERVVDTEGLVPLLSFRVEFPVPGWNRLFNRSATVQSYRDGVAVAGRPGFLDVTDTLRAAGLSRPG